MIHGLGIGFPPLPFTCAPPQLPARRCPGWSLPRVPSIPVGLHTEAALLPRLFSQVVNVLFHKQPCGVSDPFVHYTNGPRVHPPPQKIGQ